MCGSSINPSVQKLWREKANMQMSMYLSRLALAGFEYRACISRYLKAKHCVQCKRLIFSPPVTLWTMLWCQSLTRAVPDVIATNLRSLSVDSKFLKPTVGYALPAIPLSLGIKLELLSELRLCQTSVYFPVSVRVYYT